jgi:inosine-uridine nucleoside N-ribohydrolase
MDPNANCTRGHQREKIDPEHFTQQKVRNLKGGKDEKKGGKAKGGKKQPKKVKSAQPVIFDTDYGPFIDDIFALGLLVNSGDLLDLKYIVTTSEVPDLSAKCVTKQLEMSGRSDIPVGQGAFFPAYDQRGGVCGIPGLVGFALEGACKDVDLPYDEDGIAAVAKMIVDSGRSDWWYIVVGGQSSVKILIEEYPEAAAMINTLVIMGGNWCSGERLLVRPALQHAKSWLLHQCLSHDFNFFYPVPITL